MTAAGGLWTSCGDLGRFLRFQLGNGTIEGREVLDPALMEQMRTVPAPDAGAPAGYALGVARTRWRAGQYLDLFNHGGGGNGFLTDLWWLPQLQLGIAVLTNSSEHDLQGSLALQILADLVTRPDSPYHDRLLALPTQSDVVEPDSHFVPPPDLAQRIAALALPATPEAPPDGPGSRSCTGPARPGRWTRRRRRHASTSRPECPTSTPARTAHRSGTDWSSSSPGCSSPTTARPSTCAVPCRTGAAFASTRSPTARWRRSGPARPRGGRRGRMAAHRRLHRRPAPTGAAATPTPRRHPRHDRADVPGAGRPPPSSRSSAPSPRSARPSASGVVPGHRRRRVPRLDAVPAAGAPAAAPAAGARVLAVALVALLAAGALRTVVDPPDPAPATRPWPSR